MSFFNGKLPPQKMMGDGGMARTSECRLRTQRPAQTGPGCQNLAFQRFEPIILCSFLLRFQWRTLESHNSKQMMVYEQISFFIKIVFFKKMFWIGNRFFDWKIDFSIKKPEQNGVHCFAQKQQGSNNK